MGKIGIMGGTFDPIHNGHLLLGRQAYREYGLNQVWYMPSGQPPHKKDRKVTPASVRCEMTKLAVAEYPYFKFSDFEVRRSGNTYTAQTLSLLREEYPEHSFYFIIGADSLYEIESWHEPADVMAQAVLLVADRDYGQANVSIDEQIGYLKRTYGADIQKLHCTEVDISSEELRHMSSRGKSIKKYVPAEVADYIETHHLYQEMN